LSDLNPKLEQFAMDTRHAQKLIFDTHLPTDTIVETLSLSQGCWRWI